MAAVTIASSIAAATSTLRAAGVDAPALDAELLHVHALDRDRAWLRAHADDPLPADAATEDLVARRARREPLAYILGWTPFLGLRLRVTPDVLVPRPETETFVEEVVRRMADTLPATLVDVGSGSGAIALALARAWPETRVVGTDVSSAALEIARENAAANGISNAFFQEADLLSGIAPAELIVANLPYLTAEEMRVLPPELAHEPTMALAGGADGNALVERLIDQLPAGCAVALELHPMHAASIAATIGGEVFQDLAGVGRFVWRGGS